MATVADPVLPMEWITVADLWDRLGNVPLERIHLIPTPGTATEQDVLDQIRSRRPDMRIGRWSLGGEDHGL